MPRIYVIYHASPHFLHTLQVQIEYLLRSVRQNHEGIMHSDFQIFHLDNAVNLQHKFQAKMMSHHVKRLIRKCGKGDNRW